MMTVEAIEEYIRSQGSDDLGTFGGDFVGGIHCQQIPDELAPCIAAIYGTGEAIQSYLEIGSAAGGTAFLFHHFFRPERMILIDDNKHDKAGLRKQILRDVPRVEIEGRSDDEQVLASAKQLAPFDIILIDGDHHYPAVKLDTLFYLQMLTAGGFLILHDSARTDWGVGRVVKELLEDPNLDFIGEYRSMRQAPLGLALFRKVTG